MTAPDYSQLVVFNYGKPSVAFSFSCTLMGREGSIVVTVLFSKFSIKADLDHLFKQENDRNERRPYAYFPPRKHHEG
jgi:hypothetical protein